MNKIEHLGIAVLKAENSIQIFNDLLGSAPYRTEEVESEGVKTVFYQLGESKIELLEATNPTSPIAKFIEKRGEGIHHIAFSVTNIYTEIERLKQLGYTPLTDKPKAGADNKLIIFMHPKQTNGVLIELCQDNLNEED